MEFLRKSLLWRVFQGLILFFSRGMLRLFEKFNRLFLFGSHRKPEGVMLPYSLFERLIPEIEEILLAERVRERIADGSKSLPLEKLIKELGFKNSDFEK